MWQEGRMKELEEKWWTQVPEYCSLQMERGLGLFEFMGTFSLFAVGIGFAMLFLAIEFAVFVGQKTIRRRKAKAAEEAEQQSPTNDT
ncbi:unnamed protein product [Echinostoma caproni]|uniref:Copper transporter n=1 Tax=Echinostoma caproni TaxID=27848 RepID=A0A183AMB0_9TREM|nr:unnamed protein product [Echinostoma caproni]